MELKNIFKMTKTDRYTQDGRDELAKLQETEDVKYKTGDISQKTGLQKQPDGSWAPPKNAGKNVHGAEIDKIYEKHQKRIKELKAKGYTDEQIENDKIYQQTKEDMRNVGKSKPEEKSLAGTPMKKADLNSKDPYEITHSMKPDTASEAKEMDKISAFMQEETGATLRNAITARESFYKNTKNPTPEQQEGLAALMKIQQKLGYGKPAEGPALNGQKKTVSYQEMQKGPLYGPAAKKEAWMVVSPSRMQRDLDGNFWSRPEDFEEDITSRGWDVEEMTNEYAVISNENGSQYEVRFDDHSDYGDLTVKSFKALMVDEDDEDDLEDAAPKIRELTGDCKIRIRPETQDKVYQIGEISQKTGLQKTANGWRPVKKNGKRIQVVENSEGRIAGVDEVKAETSKPAGSSREARVNEYWSKIRKETQPVARMAAELDRGTFDDDVINTMGDGQSMEDLARSLISPAFEEVGYIPQDKLDTARKIIRKRYRALENEATGDSAPRQLTGDTRIRIRK